MPSTNSRLNQRAAVWATIVLVAALLVAWTPFLIWPLNETPRGLPFILGAPGIVMLIPGVLISGMVWGLVWVLFHQSEIIRATSGDTYFVVGGVGLHWSLGFLSALLVDWSLYFLIARQVIKARQARKA